MKCINRFTILIVLALFILASCAENKTKTSNEKSISVKLLKIADGLHSPVSAVFAPDGSMLIVEQTGQIRLIKDNSLVEKPIYDMQNKLVKLSGAYDERGLLGIALHPNFSQNKKLYLYYSAPSDVKGSDHQSIISEFKLINNSFQVDAASERVLLSVQQPESNHNGGELKFGPDGFLYIGLGDGGGAGDKHGTIGNGQDLNTFLGKILRIDVNTDATYIVPQDNPFVSVKDAKPEIWAYGLRNPWRFSFDKKSAKLFVADVGQNKFEEVNIVEKGGNYGWKIIEASHCYDPESNCKTEGLKLPIHEYEHKDGISITGGYVYNGSAIPMLKGKYIFADWTGPMFFLEQSEKSWQKGNIELLDKPSGDLKILGFAEDLKSELYVLTNKEVGPKGSNGAIYKIVKP
jgi:glucose/arabinose dehydrogenase